MCNRTIIYTYKNTDEFNRFYYAKIEDGYRIYPFTHDQIDDLMQYEEKIIVDLSSLIYLLKNSSSDIFYATRALIKNNGTTFIINETLADFALDNLQIIFYKKEKLYESLPEIEIQEEFNPVERKTIYIYDDNVDINKILEYTTKNNMVYINFSKMQKNQQKIKNNDKVILDLTSVIQVATSANLQLLYSIEQLIDDEKLNIECTIQRKYIDEALQLLPLYFDKSDEITNLLKGLEIDAQKIMEEKKQTKLITKLPKNEFNIFCEYISKNLIGHDKFKSSFFQKLKHFITLNTIKKRKIFSVFLYGNSGLGKTEVGRLIKNFLDEDSKLIKINFGNYSSDHALNNLIGSPNGYIGCDGGELSKKLDSNNAGVIVFDEFEKANRPVFDFFLELLEDGSYTDSMSREYDLDGYILIFTSNIISENDIYNRIPPEFISRCDLICGFDKLNAEEREVYIDFQINSFINYVQKPIPDIKITNKEILELKTEIYNSNTCDLRTLKKMIEEKLIEKFDIDGVHEKKVQKEIGVGSF